MIVIHQTPGQLAFPPPEAMIDAEPAEPILAVEIRRSERRRRTVAAKIEDNTLVVYVPARMSRAEEAEWVERMRKKLIDRRRRDRLNSAGDLERRAQELNDRYFGGRLKWNSITYVTNQKDRYGSCTYDDATIRLSHVVADMPGWVRDYVLVHELAHLEVPDHSRRFWSLVERYPLTERARGFLIAKGMES